MNTVKMWQTVSTSSENTEKLGEQLGQQLQGGEVIELISDLGGGKTTLVRGVARGVGSHDHVSSPTFKISNEYKGEKLKLYHFDFYRLNDPGIIAHEMHDILSDPESSVVIEWGEVVQHVLPEERLSIELSASGEQERQIKITYPKQLEYLMEKL